MSTAWTRLGSISRHFDVGLEHPLTEASSTPPFSTDELQKLLDHDSHEERQGLKNLMKDPLFLPRYNITVNEERRLALARLQAICRGKFFSVLDFKNDPLRIFAAHEVAGWCDGAMATKMTVQFNLFGGTVLKLGTRRHHDAFMDGIDSLDAIGCFALTELGYGNNAVEMETTATFVRSMDQFVLNTPSTKGQKYWITNSAVDAQWAVVFAQLIIDSR